MTYDSMARYANLPSFYGPYGCVVGRAEFEPRGHIRTTRTSNVPICSQSIQIREQCTKALSSSSRDYCSPKGCLNRCLSEATKDTCKTITV